MADVLAGGSSPEARVDFNITNAQVHITGFYIGDAGPQGDFTLAVLRVQAAGSPGQCADLGVTVRLLADASDAEIQAEAIGGRVCIVGG